MTEEHRREMARKLAREIVFAPSMGNDDREEWLTGLLAAAFTDVESRERSRCLAEVRKRESYQMGIPCPEGLPGCCVFHSVPAKRDRTPAEIEAAINATE
jgi:hypothetical protein